MVRHSKYTNPSPFRIAVGLFVAVIIVIWAAIAPFWTAAWHQTEAVNKCTVIGKHQIKKSKGGKRLLVQTDRCGTLQVANDVFTNRWDSRDDWDRLAIGTAYEMKYIGWEYPLLSINPNIIDYHEVKKEAAQ